MHTTCNISSTQTSYVHSHLPIPGQATRVPDKKKIPANNNDNREFIMLLTKMLKNNNNKKKITPYPAMLKKVRYNTCSHHFSFWQTNQLTGKQTDTGENSISLMEVISWMWQMMRRQLWNFRSLFDLAFLGMYFFFWETLEKPIIKGNMNKIFWWFHWFPNLIRNDSKTAKWTQTNMFCISGHG